MTHVVGIDFGTLSGRAVVVRAADGAEVGSAVHEYAHGVMDRELASSGERLPAHWALQDPEDYLDVLREAVPAAITAAGIAPADVIGIGTDFTASSPMPVLRDGTPLCRVAGFEDRPHAYVKLWKHHAAQGQADRVNAVAAERGEPWLARYGGRISSEWEFAKALQMLQEDPEAFARADRWIEAADWIVWQLCGRETRNTCTAGYKAIYQDGRYPSREYLAALDERFAGFVEDKLEHPLSDLGARAGGLTAEAAGWTGLPEGIAVAVGNVDAHVTAPAARAIEPGQMLAVMGTSTCHVMNASSLAEVPGMCGVVQGGITPGLWGYEAGQSGVGDIFGWFVDNAVPPRYFDEARRRGVDVHTHLSELAIAQDVGRARPRGARLGEREPLGAGRPRAERADRRPHARHPRRGRLPRADRGDGVRHPQDHRDLRRGGRAGARAGRGGRAAQEPGGHADLRRRHALPAAPDRLRPGARARGGHPRRGRGRRAPGRGAASEAMGTVRRDVYTPDAARADAYDALYEHYSRLHDHFGRGGDDVMHALRGRESREAVGA